MLSVVVVAIAYPSLPEQIPTHFNAAGQADDWSPRPWAFLMPIMGVAMTGGIAALSRHPRIFNYPTTITLGNAQRLYREGERMMVWLGASVAVCFAGGVASTVGAPGVPIMIAGLVGCVVTLFAGVIRLSRVEIRAASHG